MNISLICACKNRYNALKVSLNSWIHFKEIKEIIIVDWSSDNPIDHLTELDERIKVVRVSGKEYFNQPQPLNLAASMASGDYILKVDTDYIINPYYNFFEKYCLKENEFVSGNHSFGRREYYDSETNTYKINISSMSESELRNYFDSYSPFFRYLIGLLFIKKEDFQKVGGYNESLGKCYAYEDDEMFQRLRLLGLQEKKLDFDNSIIHLPHPDNKRIEYFEGFEGSEDYSNAVRNNLSSFYSEEELEWQVQYALTEKHIDMNRNLIGQIEHYYVKPKTQWKIMRMNEQKYVAEEVISSEKLEGFPTVYCMSLDKSGDRRKELSSQFSQYNIVPKFLISKRFVESNDNVYGKYLHQLNDGTKGCCVSHLKAIKEWYETTEEDYGFFCEDDLSLETVSLWNFTWNQFVESIPEDADCVQLLTIRGNYDTFDLRERYWDDWAATAYILTRDCAQKIIETFIKEDGYKLEVPNYEVMPLIENILFASVCKTYTVPLFVENTEFESTFVNQDNDVDDGQKTNHRKARNLVLAYWNQLHNSGNQSSKTKVEKTFIEDLMEKYALDTENAEHNFNLGVWYESQGHTAPALSYYLRCAERSEDSDLAYEALIRGSYCYKKQGTRDGSSRSMLFQAQAFKPERPEAHFLLSQFSEKNEWWQDCYITADFALRTCNFDCQPLRTEVGYPGKYGLLLEKSLAAWWWGKGQESRALLQEIKNNYKVRDEHFDIIQNNLLKLATGYISDSELKYNKTTGQKLRFEFNGMDRVDKNYSQAFQDLFVLSALNGKENGTYLEIGAQEPFYQNNTALLETKFGWKGISLEIREDLCKMFSEQRSNKILCQDATQVNYTDLLDEFNQGTVIDYLQLDCEPSKTTFDIMTLIPFDKYKFRLITYEHDHYVDLTNTYRDLSRKYLEDRGYKLLVSNVSLNDWSPFEDWWYHPDLIDQQIVEKMRNISDITDVRYYMIQK